MTRETWGDRLYRRLLRLYPREFRDEYGAEMARLYRDRASHEGSLRLWLALLADVVRTAPMEQLDTFMQDIRHAFRSFARTPLVTATALLTIALGVGGSTAVFSVVYAVLLRPLPYPAPDRLVELFEDNREANRPMFRVSTPNYRSWAERTTSIEALAAFQSINVTLTAPGEPERVTGSVITASLFDVLGLPPLAGRGFRAEDEQRGATRVAVISEQLWRGRFGSDAAIVGQSITLNGEPHEVVGIMPRAFREVGRSQATSVADTQVFLPLSIDPARENRGNHAMRVVGRLRPGVSIDGATDEMRRIAAGMAQEFPATNTGWSVQLRSVHDTMLDGGVRPSLLVLLAAVLMVLLIGCANVANMLLARGVSRQREFALRSALGAGRSRLVRQLVTESVCLAVVSGACGLLLAALVVQRLQVMLPPTLPRIDDIRIDAAVFGLGVFLSIASGLVMGLVPAMRASRLALAPALAQQGKGTAAGTSRTLLRHGIVAAQMALATMLLVGAVLLVQSFVRLQHVRLGFEPEGVITARISLPAAAYADAVPTEGFWRQLLDSLEGRARFQAVAVGLSAPFAPGVRAAGRVGDQAQVRLAPDAAVPAIEQIVSADYFRTLGIPLLAGRTFGRQDGPGAPPVAVISASVARQLWPGGSPIGRTLAWNGERQHEVIGVVGDIRGSGGRGPRGGSLDEDPAAAVYFSAAQQPQATMTVVVRTAGDVSASAATIARAVRDIDPAQPVYQVRRLRDWIDETSAQPRFTATVTGAFACVAILLAAVGTYGVMAYAVAQRTQEFGVRMAMGAERAQILRLVLRSSMPWALGGIATGLLGAFGFSRALGPLLFDVGARDPLTYSTVATMLAAVATIACCIPAARATRVDPALALRAE